MSVMKILYSWKKKNMIKMPLKDTVNKEKPKLVNLDTGADVNLISKETVSKLGLGQEKVKPEKAMKAMS